MQHAWLSPLKISRPNCATMVISVIKFFLRLSEKRRRERLVSRIATLQPHGVSFSKDLKHLDDCDRTLSGLWRDDALDHSKFPKLHLWIFAGCRRSSPRELSVASKHRQCT